MTDDPRDLLLGTGPVPQVRRCLAMLRGPQLTVCVRADRRAAVAPHAGAAELLTYRAAAFTPAVLDADGAPLAARRWRRVYVVINAYSPDAYGEVLAAAHRLDAGAYIGILPNLDLLPLGPLQVRLRRHRRLLQPLLAALLYPLCLLLLPVLAAALLLSRPRPDPPLPAVQRFCATNPTP